MFFAVKRKCNSPIFRDFKIKINAIPRIRKIIPKTIDDLTHETLNAFATFLLCNAFKAPYTINEFYSSLLLSILNIFNVYIASQVFSASSNNLNVMKNIINQTCIRLLCKKKIF